MTVIPWKKILLALGITALVALGIISVFAGKAGLGAVYRWILALMASWHQASIDKIDAQRKLLEAQGDQKKAEIETLDAQRARAEKQRQDAHTKIAEVNNAKTLADMLRHSGV